MVNQKQIGLRISKKQLDFISMEDLTNQEVIRTFIDLIPKFFKLFAENNIESPQYFFSEQEEKILNSIKEKLEKEGYI